MPSVTHIIASVYLLNRHGHLCKGNRMTLAVFLPFADPIPCRAESLVGEVWNPIFGI